jgi:hypothetical protein
VVPIPGGPVGPLLLQWAESLKNRNARDDRSRVTRHLVPEFEKLKVDELTLPVVMTWVERLAGSQLSPQSQRHLLGLLSRFFSWCIERGLATTNPVRMVPIGRRPVATLDPEREAESQLGNDDERPDNAGGAENHTRVLATLRSSVARERMSVPTVLDRCSPSPGGHSARAAP